MSQRYNHKVGEKVVCDVCGKEQACFVSCTIPIDINECRCLKHKKKEQMCIDGKLKEIKSKAFIFR